MISVLCVNAKSAAITIQPSESNIFCTHITACTAQNQPCFQTCWPKGNKHCCTELCSHLQTFHSQLHACFHLNKPLGRFTRVDFFGGEKCHSCLPKWSTVHPFFVQMLRFCLLCLHYCGSGTLFQVIVRFFPQQTQNSLT